MDTLQSFCLGCAKYSAGDTTGKLLATICLAPYFVIYHAAVVLHSRREIHMLFVFLGLLVNAGLGMVIKRLLKHPRPAATCAALGNCHKYGMPSSHMQVMSFAVATCILLYRHRKRSVQQHGGGATTVHPGSQLIQLAEIAALACLAAVVGWARVYLGYHTPGQVAAGAAVGASFALVWHALTVAASKTVFPWIATLSARLGIWLRDTLAVGDVHQAEYLHVGGGASVAAGSKAKAA